MVRILPIVFGETSCPCQRFLDPNRSGVEVDTRPLQREQLSEPGSGQRRTGEKGMIRF
jgi:hypothetical protein